MNTAIGDVCCGVWGHVQCALRTMGRSGGGVPRDWTMSLWDFQWTLATIPLNPQCLSSYIILRLCVERLNPDLTCHEKY